ncbi:MAG TPA: PAS domain S-box protein [Candidatus Acidoferrum sp.]|nr:PAS domain S-box protein [Candidatus Acidoferrum sp.]
MTESANAKKKWMVEIHRLRSRLAEVEDSLGAIQRGEVDALVVSGSDGDQIYTLQGAEHPYRVMVEAINEGAATLLRDGTVLYTNRQFANMLGQPLEKLIGKSLLDFFSPQMRPAIREILLRAGSGAVRCEVELPQEGGSVLPSQLSINPFNDSGTDALCLVATDLSQQKCAELERVLAERALTEHEERNRLVLSNIKDYAIFVLDPGGNITSWDSGAERVHAFTADQIVGRHFSGFYAHEDVERRQPEIDLQIAATEDRVESEGWRLRADGSRFWANVILTSLRDEEGKLRGIICVTRDITDRKRSEEELRKLSTRLLSLQDQERRRIARELHDSEGQNLSLLLMSLSKLKRTCEKLDPDARTLLTESIEIANECLREVRTLSYLLHPPLLDEFGLISALQWYVEGFSERSGIGVSLDVPAALNRLPAEMETSLFRLVQEGLTNIHRHSGSETAEICLVCDHRELRLKIEDHGKGMTAAEISGTNGAARGVGLASMRERVRELGGNIEIASEAGRTQINVTLPMGVASRTQTA